MTVHKHGLLSVDGPTFVATGEPRWPADLDAGVLQISLTNPGTPAASNLATIPRRPQGQTPPRHRQLVPEAQPKPIGSESRAATSEQRRASSAASHVCVCSTAHSRPGTSLGSSAETAHQIGPDRWEMLRLVHEQGLTQKQIARRLGIAASDIGDEVAYDCGSWPWSCPEHADDRRPDTAGACQPH